MHASKSFQLSPAWIQKQNQTVNVFNGPKSHYWYNPGSGQQVNNE